jgi:hypothetical protein
MGVVGALGLSRPLYARIEYLPTRFSPPPVVFFCVLWGMRRTNSMGRRQRQLKAYQLPNRALLAN